MEQFIQKYTYKQVFENNADSHFYGNTAQMPQSALYNRFRIKTVDNL